MLILTQNVVDIGVWVPLPACGFRAHSLAPDAGAWRSLTSWVLGLRFSGSHHQLGVLTEGVGRQSSLYL